MAATRPAAAGQASLAQAADCDGAEEKTWLEYSGAFRTIYYANCRDHAVRRQAYVVRLMVNYLGCKDVPPGVTVSWSTANDAALFGIASC